MSLENKERQNPIILPEYISIPLMLILINIFIICKKYLYKHILMHIKMKNAMYR